MVALGLSRSAGQRAVDVDLREQLTSFGMPPDAITQVSVGANWAAAGGAEYVTEHVSRILDRPANTFEQWARAHRAMFDAMR